jgi:hypothetical protein
MGLVQVAAPAGATTAAAVAGAVVPDLDPFYAAPANIAGYAPGAVVGTRTVAAKSSIAVNAWQISYRTNDSHDQPELAVTTVLVPTAAWTGAGGRPAVSEQTAEYSTGTQCAPSYSVSTGGSVLNASAFLGKGWAVAVPDYEGPKSAWMAGPQAGHAVLDGVRAVRNFTADGVGATSPWALDGYSGGAEATGWAAQLQASYAPELHFVAAALGGLPADPGAVAKSLDGGLFSGFEFAATYGLNADFPEAGIPAILNANGQRDLAAVKGKCLSDILGGFALKTLSSDSTTRTPLTVPSVAAVLQVNTLGASAPKMPIFDYHADTDEVVPVAQDTTAVRAWCAKGASVEIIRDLVGEHIEEGAFRAASAQQFIANEFAGKKPTNNCGY